MKIEIKPINNKPIITFDMDQTLIDSNKCHIEAYKYMLNLLECRREVHSKVRNFAGNERQISSKKINWADIIRQKTRYEAVELLCPEFNKSQVEKGVQIYMHRLNNHTYKFAKQKPYALKILKELKPKYSLSIVTNCTDINAKILLEKGAKIPVKLFDLIVGSNDAKNVKPSPAPLKKVEKILYSKILIHVGDSINDIIAAHKDNIPIISVATGNHKINELKQYKPEFIIKNLKPVPKIIKNLKFK